jgi:hypothetical protein
MHRSSTDRPQVLHSGASRGAPARRRRLRRGLISARFCLFVAVVAGLCGAAALRAQTADPGPVFRVFLTDGRALASYGECAVLGDRVVFTLIVGDGGVASQYQLSSLPAASVDLDRTLRYSQAIRAARYAATRGEADYVAMTAEVSRAIAELERIQDPKQRLATAEEARRRLLAWSQETYGYRAAEIQELSSLFDDVIAELHVAAGEFQLSVALSSGPMTPPVEPLLGQPSLRESIELALMAAAASDVSTERTAILRAAAMVSAGAAGVADLAVESTRRLEDEHAADRAYAPLVADALARAEDALRRGDVRAAEAARAEAMARDRLLGSRRPDEVQALLRQLDATIERTRAHRLALDHYALVRPRLLAYERALRPVLRSLDDARPALEAIRDMRGPGLDRIVRVEAGLTRASRLLGQTRAPTDLADVHATLGSALHLALEACKRRRLAMAAVDIAAAREASSGAAGAGMLADLARRELVARLFPPKVR